MSTIVQRGGKDFETWAKIGDGIGTTDDIDELLHQYGAIMDYPAAMYGTELYAAYPDAKFILTTRDPVKWEASMKATILHMVEAINALPTKSPIQEALLNWNQIYMQKKYHRGRIYTHAQQELLDHNERVKQIIPPEQLLIYEVGEGWDRLVEFLEVPKPMKPFPHVNDVEQFRAFTTKFGLMPATEN